MSEKNYDCSYKEIKTLKEIKVPKKINGYFNCSNNNLITLEGSPEYVEDYYCCQYNKLISLKGRPEVINGSFDCSSNNLKTLKYRPKIINGYFNCKNNEIVKNIKQKIIKEQIKAYHYETDEGVFSFNEIEQDFKFYHK